MDFNSPLFVALFTAVFTAALTALVSGLVTWGMINVKLQWLRRDVDAAHHRLDLVNAPASFGVTRGRKDRF